MEANWSHFITQSLFDVWLLLILHSHIVKDLSTCTYLEGERTPARTKGCETGEARELIMGVFICHLPQWTTRN